MRQQAEHYLGAAIEPSEWGEAKEYAERKLDWIINREGDAGGERHKPYYLAQLIAEAVKASRFTRFTLGLCALMKCADDMGVKKGQPVS